MTVKGQFLVATLAAAAGLVALAIFWLIARPDPGYRDVAIGTLVYAATYVLTVRRAQSWLSGRAQFVVVASASDSD